MPGGGGLLQLVAKGKQDVFLTGNPQITWFKMVYRRYTNFAIESQPMYFDGTPNFGKRITCTIPRRGDLLGPVFLEVTLPALTYSDGVTPVKWVNSIGHALIQEIAFEVGEVEMDRQTGEWMEIWSRFTVNASRQEAFYNMIGKVDNYNPSQPPGKLYIPLQFWFCKNPGVYLPLLALQYHQIRITIVLRNLSSLIYPDPASITNPTIPACPVYSNASVPIELMLYGDYVYLDTEERRRFVSSSHEYLIDQVQYTPSISIPTAATSITIPVEFNNPIKEFMWVLQRDDLVSLHREWFNYSSLGIREQGIRTDLMESALIQFDGIDRFYPRDAGYFRLVQPYQKHTAVPVDSFIYNYSFALRPEEMQPSGSANASRLDSIVFQINLTQGGSPPPGFNTNTDITIPNGRGNLHCVIYATNNNVFRVVEGFGGLLFTI
jgi:hypothetical protein